MFDWVKQLYKMIDRESTKHMHIQFMCSLPPFLWSIDRSKVIIIETEREISFSTIQSNILPSMMYLPADKFTVSPAFFSLFTWSNCLSTDLFFATINDVLMYLKMTHCNARPCPSLYGYIPNRTIINRNKNLF